MSRPDPLFDTNRHVRDFARAHRLRTSTREDGEVVLRIGPHKAQHAVLGLDKRSHRLDCHASYGLRPGVWTLFVGPTTPHRVGRVAARWRRLGIVPKVLDFETWADVAEGRFLDVAAMHPLTRTHRRRKVSEAVRTAATERLAALRRPVVRSSRHPEFAR